MDKYPHLNSLSIEDKACSTCIYSKLNDNEADKPRPYSCRKHAPKRIHGSATCGSNQRFPRMAADELCGDYLADSEEE